MNNDSDRLCALGELVDRLLAEVQVLATERERLTLRITPLIAEDRRLHAEVDRRLVAAQVIQAEIDAAHAANAREIQP